MICRISFPSRSVVLLDNGESAASFDGTVVAVETRGPKIVPILWAIDR